MAVTGHRGGTLGIRGIKAISETGEGERSEAMCYKLYTNSLLDPPAVLEIAFRSRHGETRLSKGRFRALLLLPGQVTEPAPFTPEGVYAVDWQAPCRFAAAEEPRLAACESVARFPRATLSKDLPAPLPTVRRTGRMGVHTGSRPERTSRSQSDS
jgi:hypothetical protein